MEERQGDEVNRQADRVREGRGTHRGSLYVGDEVFSANLEVRLTSGEADTPRGR